MPIKQSFCYPLFTPPNMSLEELFSWALDIGYEATELWFRDDEFSSLAATIQKSGLKIASICGHHSLANGYNDKTQHKRIEKEIRDSIDLAVEWNIPGIITFAGNRLNNLSDEEALHISTDFLRQVAPYAEEKGINLNLELLNSKVDHPGYQADHSEWGLQLCKAVDSPRIKLLYDIYHMQIMEGDIIRTIRNNIQWIGHFHTAGNPGRNDLDETQELNYSGICRAINETDYDLYLAHEFSPKGDQIDALKKAFFSCDV
jgi:hydroxypyruvate isomerase